MAESLKEHTRSFLNGVVSGIASILPGVSGGLILVLCGSYERLIEDIGHLRSKLVPEFWFLVAIGCGLLVGMGSCVGTTSTSKGSTTSCGNTGSTASTSTTPRLPASRCSARD